MLKIMKIQLRHKYEDIISVENLLAAWSEFIKGKRGKNDVQQFQLHLMDNILALHRDLVNFTYRHGDYQAFKITDPKPRLIHKAAVRDRLLHHALYRILYPFFDRIFITDSYSCRIDKGTHKAINRFRGFAYKVSQNNTRTCWILKCDIQKFFASIDHEILVSILTRYIPEYDTLWLLDEVISSFNRQSGVGLPLGNLTSQLFVNIYMTEFDQFVKHKVTARYYLRYADDFMFMSASKNWLEGLIPKAQRFLGERLKLAMPADKVSLTPLAAGVDFLGWVHFSDHRILRTNTKRKMFRRIVSNPELITLASYLGLLQHGNTTKLSQQVSQRYLLAREGSLG
jgi:RNA-directed DNA polymerase